MNMSPITRLCLCILIGEAIVAVPVIMACMLIIAL